MEFGEVLLEVGNLGEPIRDPISHPSRCLIKFSCGWIGLALQIPEPFEHGLKAYSRIAYLTISIIQVGPDVRHLGKHAVRGFFVFYEDEIYSLSNRFYGTQDLFVNCLRVEVIASDELAETVLVLRQLAVQPAVRPILAASGLLTGT